jgi:ABC-type glycerol-3-phosphate transport system substrate-binding protein
MKKKTLLWSMLTVMMVTMLSVGFVACGSDDDDDDNGTTSSSSVVGTWKGQEGNDSMTATFNADGTSTWIEVDGHSDGRPADIKQGTFTYMMQGADRGIIVSKSPSSYYYSGESTETNYFIFQGNVMYIYDDGYNDDLEFVLTRVQ